MLGVLCLVFCVVLAARDAHAKPVPVWTPLDAFLDWLCQKDNYCVLPVAPGLKTVLVTVTTIMTVSHCRSVSNIVGALENITQWHLFRF